MHATVGAPHLVLVGPYLRSYIDVQYTESVTL